MHHATVTRQREASAALMVMETSAEQSQKRCDAQHCSVHSQANHSCDVELVPRRGRETKAPERTLSSIERLKGVGARWWGKTGMHKRSSPRTPRAKPRGLQLTGLLFGGHRFRCVPFLRRFQVQRLNSHHLP